jgi:twitching motility two-component system response regulator PilH
MACVLIIDDSPTETYQFKSMLEKNGFTVLQANNAAEGLLIAEQQQPDAILMDVVMPGLNGFQATRQLSRIPKAAHIPVIMVTTKDQEADQVWARRQGAKGYLTKPVDEALLMDCIRQLLAASAASAANAVDESIEKNK